MPRKHIRNPEARAYKSYRDEDMQKAVEDIRSGKLSMKKAACLYKINRTTLLNHFHQKKCSTVGRPTALSKTEEELLVHSLIKLAEWGFGLDRQQLQKCVQDHVRRTDKKNPFRDGMPGIDWCRLFEKRWGN